ncbi:MAG: preprotein translocase subunit SecA [Phycisphaeraceae bacterium]|nr:preprotein translocase subunit SecA [Phycisphaeraceae bacterium]
MPATTNKPQGIPLIGPVLNWLIGSRNERFVKRYTQRVAAINSLESQARVLTDAQLRGKLAEFRSRIDKGQTGQDLLVDAFAIAREAMDRAVGIRNIFNPKFAEQFDATRLPDDARAMYEAVKAEIAGKTPLLPRTYDPKLGQPAADARPDDADEFRGCSELVPAWMQVDIPPALYEAVRAMLPRSRPPFRARPFDVQLIGGMVLSGGKISEMKTGEGKTIVGPLACYLAAIEGLKVHVVTVNDYLVQRDRDWTFPYFHALGLTVGAIHPVHMQPEALKREMYKCDVVYGTTAEFGFDYLRDNMKPRAEMQVQRRREFAIVDEVDSILIDEARTPLIISGPAHEGAPRYELANRLALHLVEKQKPWQQADDRVQHCLRTIKGLEGDIRNARDKSKIPQLQEQMKAAKEQMPGLEAERSNHTQYYEIELDKRQAHLTHDGIAEAQRVAGVGSFYVGENMDLPHLLEQAVRAHVVYQLDRDYIVMPTQNPDTGRMEPSIVIVDVNTGRPMIGRQWSDGLHQAVETKEGVPIRQETQTVATVTIQNFFKMYKRLAGMTGTADTEAQEFHDIYRLDVVSIPTNVAVVRRDFDDLMFLTAKDKWDFIVDEIKQFHDVGRPVLVGTTSVEKSETLSKMLTGKHGIKHEVLNAKQHERESHMIENAGQLGAVMIATNMAGRGTDIKLGAVTREALLDHWLRRGICSRELTVNATDDQVRENVYRKVAPRELEIPKREADEMPIGQLELRLLRHWAMHHTWVSPKKIDSMDAESLKKELDRHGRCLMHRVGWVDSVEDLGGLHVIGTERHESRRIDNQLRGRSGRQGDKGSSRFFVSLEDELMKRFAGERTMKILATLGMREGDAIEHPMLSKSVERAQRKVEEWNFQGRKNLLEYDEIMEHQRRAFYGLRQRVLEGRDVKGLIFEYIEQATTEACDDFLDKGYAAQCASEYARQQLDVTIEADRLRGLDLGDLEKRIRADARDEVRAQISVTLGEYMPSEGAEFEMDFDAEGLAKWARTHFGVELDPAHLRERGLAERAEIQEQLGQAAERRIAAANLDGLAQFVERHYGATELSKWGDRKFGFVVPPADIAKAEQTDRRDVVKLFLDRARDLYAKREIEYPVDFAMDLTMSMMRQSPQNAAQQLVDWANQRLQLGWTVEQLVRTPPARCREELMAGSKRFVESGTLQKTIDEALSLSDHDARVAFFKDRLRTEWPEANRRFEGEELEHAVRAKVESVLRAELLYFERTMLLETLDPSWKDHLYAMDQLRDSIGFRAFSQRDPRIEYKREGSALFQQMMENVRERVTDYVFKVRITPQFVPPGAPPQGAGGGPRPIATAPPARPSSSPGIAGSMIAGPGLEVSTAPAAPAAPSAAPQAAAAPAAQTATAPPPPSAISAAAAGSAPMSDRQQRDLEAAQRAGAAGEAPKAAPVVRAEKRLGRNDPCPQGSGRKYKKCCNRPDGTCTGEGLKSASPDNGTDD